MRLAQYLIRAKAFAVGPEKSDKECICQADFENDCMKLRSKIHATVGPDDTSLQESPVKTWNNIFQVALIFLSSSY
jgi:hypothetical protein